MDFEIVVYSEADFMEVVLDTERFTLVFNIDSETRRVTGTLIVYSRNEVERKVGINSLKKIVESMFNEVRYSEDKKVHNLIHFTGIVETTDEKELVKKFSKHLQSSIRKHYTN